MHSEDVERARRTRARLGGRLRRLRVHAGMGQRDIAAALGISQAKVSKIETGAQSPTIPDIKAWLKAAGASQEETDELLFLGERLHVRAPSWSDEYAQGMAGKQRQVGEIERAAAHIRVFDSEAVPGLLQTAEYARGLFAVMEDYGASDSDAAIVARLARQQVLYDQTKRFEFLVTEAALWWRPGSPQMLAAQLEHVGHVGALPNVWLGVIPLASRATALHQSFLTYDETLAVVETVTREPAVTDPDEVAFHIARFEQLKTSAVTAEHAQAALQAIRAALLADS